MCPLSEIFKLETGQNKFALTDKPAGQCGLKEQCVGGFRTIYWQKWNIIFIIMFSLVYHHLCLVA